MLMVILSKLLKSNQMNKLYILVGLAIALLNVSCDDRETFLEELNTNPSLSFQGSEEAVFTDSVKVSLKSGKEFSEIQLSAEDIDDNIKSISYEIKTGEGTLSQNGIEKSGELDINADLILKYTPSQIGVHTIIFTILDEFDETYTITAEITAFSNLSPIADFVVTPIKSTGLYEYEIDASSSFDQDQNFGGSIAEYKYNVNGLIFTSTSSKTKFDFGKPDTYTIQVSVTDLDGTTSNITEKTVTIN